MQIYCVLIRVSDSKMGDETLGFDYRTIPHPLDHPYLTYPYQYFLLPYQPETDPHDQLTLTPDRTLSLTLPLTRILYDLVSL